MAYKRLWNILWLLFSSNINAIRTFFTFLQWTSLVCMWIFMFVHMKFLWSRVRDLPQVIVVVVVKLKNIYIVFMSIYKIFLYQHLSPKQKRKEKQKKKKNSKYRSHSLRVETHLQALDANIRCQYLLRLWECACRTLGYCFSLFTRYPTLRKLSIKIIFTYDSTWRK